MEDKNYTTLRNALDRLPTYQAPEMIWESLETELERMQTAMPALPQYDPAPDIWENIEAGLDRDLKAKKARSSWTVIRSWQRLAAAIVILVLASTLFFRQYFLPQDSIAVHEEKIDALIQKTVQEAENPAFDMVQTICLEQKNLCQQPEFQQLKTELDELTAAKNELKNALGNYGNDPGLVMEMVKIERERSKILEQMVRMI